MQINVMWIIVGMTKDSKPCARKLDAPTLERQLKRLHLSKKLEELVTRLDISIKLLAMVVVQHTTTHELRKL